MSQMLLDECGQFRCADLRVNLRQFGRKLLEVDPRLVFLDRVHDAASVLFEFLGFVVVAINLGARPPPHRVEITQVEVGQRKVLTAGPRDRTRRWTVPTQYKF